MKNSVILMTITVFAVLTACGTMDQNIQARKNLEKCTFELEDLKLNRIEFEGIAPKLVDLDIYLKITNPTENDVVMDRVEADVFLDRTKTTNIEHKKFLRLKGRESSVERVLVELPAKALIKLAKERPETVTVDGKVYANILMGSFTLATSIPIPIRKTFPIPWDRIDAEIAKKKGQAVEKAEDKAKDLTKDLKKKLR